MTALKVSKKEMIFEEDNRNFKFGNNVLFPSTKQVSIPLELGSMKERVKVSIVDADIPLLLGRPDMDRLGFVIDFNDNILTIKGTGESFKLQKSKHGHLCLPLVTNPFSEEIFNLKECSYEDKLKKIKKIHQSLCHPKKEILLKFFQDSSTNDEQTLQAVKEVSDNCHICLTHKRTPSDPKVGLPLACDFNQCVTLDLKGPINVHKHYIMYAIDSFSRLTRGIIIKKTA